MWLELRAQGLRVGKQRVQRLMQRQELRGRGKKRFRVVTTDSKHSLPIAPNRLDRKFLVGVPDRVWAGDLTYIGTEEGWLCLAVVVEVFSRRIVGWSLRPDIQAEIVRKVLEMAWYRRRLTKGQELMFPRGRGSQYASDNFRRILDNFGIVPSMSRKGNCWDNACAETLFGSLKVARLAGRTFATRREARDEALEWIHWYNNTRMHSTPNYLSPAQFDENWHRAETAVGL